MAYERFPVRTAQVGSLTVERAIPRRGHRTIGAWCFLDRYGPLSFTDAKPMDTGEHPHIGLQTLSWLFSGEILHHDSLGNAQLIRPGHVNLMTAGRGIAHSEETPRSNGGTLYGVQLWIALPDAHRNNAPAFEHHSEVAVATVGPLVVRMLAGSLGDARSATTIYSPIVGAELFAERDADVRVPLDPAFEHALMLIEGSVATFDGEPLDAHEFSYFDPGQSELPLRVQRGARLLLLGGEPFGEQIVMWWNFVARTNEEVDVARAAWEQHERFGKVDGYRGPRIEAPPLALTLRPA